MKSIDEIREEYVRQIRAAEDEGIALILLCELAAMAYSDGWNNAMDKTISLISEWKR